MKAPKEHWIEQNIDFPLKVLRLGTDPENHIRCGAHWHQFMEIIYVAKGHMSIVINGKHHTMGKDNIIFIGPGSIHSTKDLNEGNTMTYVLFFTPELIKSSLAESIEQNYINNFLKYFHTDEKYQIITAGKSQEGMAEFLGHMFEASRQEDIGFELNLKGYFYQFIYMMLKNEYIINTERFSEENSTEERIEWVLRYIDEHYMDDIDMAFFSNKMDLSYFYFSKLFKRVVGKSFKQYIDFIRVGKAEQMMTDATLNVSEVAAKVGVPDVTSFYRIYKRIRGYSPSYFKKYIRMEEWT